MRSRSSDPLAMDISKVHPGLRGPMRRVPPLPIGTALGRWVMRRLVGLVPTRDHEGVTIEQRDDLHSALRLYRPHARRLEGALLWLHGGGMVIGRVMAELGQVVEGPTPPSGCSTGNE